MFSRWFATIWHTIPLQAGLFIRKTIARCSNWMQCSASVACMCVCVCVSTPLHSATQHRTNTESTPDTARGTLDETLPGAGSQLTRSGSPRPVSLGRIRLTGSPCTHRHPLWPRCNLCKFDSALVQRRVYLTLCVACVPQTNQQINQLTYDILQWVYVCVCLCLCVCLQICPRLSALCTFGAHKLSPSRRRRQRVWLMWPVCRANCHRLSCAILQHVHIMQQCSLRGCSTWYPVYFVCLM